MQSTLVQNVSPEIEMYLANGWRILPVWGISKGICKCADGPDCRQPGKHPINSGGVNTAQCSLSQYRPGQNVGIACGDNLTVLDIDGEPGLASLQALGQPPETPVVASARGYHYYFRGSLPTRTGVLPGVDIRGPGSYVVAPPSVHASGIGYVWLFPPSQYTLASVDWLADALATHSTTIGPRIDPALVQSALSYLAPEDYETWLECGMALCDAGLFETWDQWSQRAAEKYPGKDELLKKAQSFRRSERRLTIGTVFFRAQEAGWSGWTYTDAGNAERLVFRLNGQAHWVPQIGWFLWSGQRWKKDQHDEILGEATQSAHAIRREDNEAAKKWSTASLSRGKIEAAIHLSRPSLAVDAEVFDQQIHKLTVVNGELDLTSGLLAPHSPATYSSRLATVRHDPVAECPLWDEFLDRILPDPTVREYAQRAVGYSLTGSTEEQVLFVCYGTGGNGKSTMLEILRLLFGEYAASIPFPALANRQPSTGPTPELARLISRRLVLATEPELGVTLGESVIKNLTGSDTIVARNLHCDYLEFTPQFKLWLATNHRLSVRGTDEGIWRRIKEIPFTVQIPTSQRDKQLQSKLRKELPGILNWALRGCQQWREHGLAEPTNITQAIASYKISANPVVAWAEQCGYAALNWVPQEKIHADYSAWAVRLGEFPLSSRVLATRLTDLGWHTKRSGSGNVLRRI